MSQRPLVAIALTAVLAVAACASETTPSPSSGPPSGPPASGTPSAEPKPAQLDRIKLALNGNVNNFNNCKNQAGPDAQAMGLIAGYLYRWGRDSELIPELAESLESSADGLTWTLKIRPDAKYSDGTPVTADDVVFQYERCKDAPVTYKVFLNTITSVEATDATTVVYRMSSPKVIFPEFFGFWFAAIWPKALVSANEDEFFKRPIGAGPYVLAQGQIGDPSFILEENPTYVLGPRAVKTIELVAVPDVTSRALQLVQGQIDFAYQLPPSTKNVDTPGVEKWTHIPGSLYRVNFNLGLPADHPLRNRDVREAISLAIDREAIVSRAFFGLNQPAQGDAPSWMDEAVVATYPNGGKRDVDAAKAKLAATPFKDGFAFTLQTWGERPGYLDAALIIKENLKDLNIDVTVDNVQVGVALERMTNGNFQANFGNHGGGGPLLSWWSNAYTPTSFWGSKTFYDNPDMTALLAQIDGETDPAKIADLWRQAQELAYQDPVNGLAFLSISDDSGHLSGSRISREIIGNVAGRDNFYVGPAGAGQ